MPTLARTIYFIRTQTASCLSYMIKGSNIRFCQWLIRWKVRIYILLHKKNVLKKEKRLNAFHSFFQEYVYIHCDIKKNI